jgi:hypothetical protein
MNNPENSPAEPSRPGSTEPDAVHDVGGDSPQQAGQQPAEPQQAPSEPAHPAHPGGEQQIVAPDAHPQQPLQAPQPQSHQAQQLQAQSFEGQSFEGRPSQPQQYPSQQFQNQQPQAQPFEGQPFQPQQYPSQQYPTDSYQAASSPAQQYPAQLTQSKPRRPRVDANGVAYGVGPFTLREAVFLALAALVLIASFLPMIGGLYADLFGYTSLWAPAPWLAIPGALLLTSAAVLIVLRRLRPSQRLRVGSLSVDQFASAMAISTAGFYVGALFLLLGFSAWFGGNAFGRGDDAIVPGPGLILGLIFSLASLVPTTFAAFTSPLKDDFAHRPESPAHPLAREAAPVARRPRAVRPQAVQGQEVHSYSQENTGSVQLTPADARPEDFAAYRRKSWSPEPVAESTDTPVPSAEQPWAPTVDVHETPAAAPTVNSHVTSDDDVDEVHFGNEPAPVSAIRHVAEQETLGEADASSPASTDDEERVEPSAGAVETGVAAAEEPPAQPSNDPTPPVVSTQPFWVYSPVPLAIVDESTGRTVFEIGPSAWALAIVDRGSELVIRHDDGRVGVLRQLAGIMRG